VLKQLKANQDVDAREIDPIQMTLIPSNKNIARYSRASGVLKSFIFNILTKIKNDWQRSEESKRSNGPRVDV
jgi:hypothetical protein